MIETTRLGRTAVEITRLGLGCAPIGNLYRAMADDDARTTVDAAWECGVRYFDTAPHYGLGLSERRLGAALRAHPRDSFAVSTKVGRILEPNEAPSGSDLRQGFDVPDTLTRRFDFSADGVRRSLAESLARLDLDRVDVLYVHDPDDFLDTAIGQAIPALVRMRDEGVVGAIGVGMNSVAPLQRFVTEADIDLVMVAGRWTLLDRTAEPLLEDALARGVAVVAAAPFNSGLLARPDPPPDATFDYGPVPAELLSAARSLAEAARRSGASLPQAALQFPLRHPAVACVVVGAASADEIRSNAARFAEPIGEAGWDDLERRAAIGR
jgi:D-threo-aldose 1-dehydrogenase